MAQNHTIHIEYRRQQTTTIATLFIHQKIVTTNTRMREHKKIVFEQQHQQPDQNHSGTKQLASYIALYTFLYVSVKVSTVAYNTDDGEK